jgi:hypothetical protein
MAGTVGHLGTHLDHVGSSAMSRMVAGCRDVSSETGCTLPITGTEMRALQAASEHAVSTHGHVDGPELRTGRVDDGRESPTQR